MQLSAPASWHTTLKIFGISKMINVFWMLIRLPMTGSPFPQPWMGAHLGKDLGRVRELGFDTPALKLWDRGKRLKVKLIFNRQ